MKECILMHFSQKNIELVVSETCAPAVPGTKTAPSDMPGTRTVAGTDNRSGGKPSSQVPVLPGNSSTGV